MRPEHIARLSLPVFAYSIYVVITDDVIKSRRKRDHRLGDSSTLGGADALHCYPINELESWIFLSRRATSGLVAHESFHCVFRLMKEIGAEVENEVFAYHLEWLVCRIWKELGKAGR